MLYSRVVQVATESQTSHFTRASKRRNPRKCGGFVTKRLKRLELSTFCMASRRSSQLSYIRGTASIDRRPRLREGVCAGSRQAVWTSGAAMPAGDRGSRP